MIELLTIKAARLAGPKRHFVRTTMLPVAPDMTIDELILEPYDWQIALADQAISGTADIVRRRSPAALRLNTLLDHTDTKQPWHDAREEMKLEIEHLARRKSSEECLRYGHCYIEYHLKVAAAVNKVLCLDNPLKPGAYTRTFEGGMPANARGLSHTR